MLSSLLWLWVIPILCNPPGVLPPAETVVTSGQSQRKLVAGTEYPEIAMHFLATNVWLVAGLLLGHCLRLICSVFTNTASVVNTAIPLWVWVQSWGPETRHTPEGWASKNVKGYIFCYVIYIYSCLYPPKLLGLVWQGREPWRLDALKPSYDKTKYWL